MEDNLKDFLEKFAELERRVRKQAAADRSFRDEVQTLRDRLAGAEDEIAGLQRRVEGERSARGEARERVAALIQRLESISDGGDAAGGDEVGEASGVEQ